MLAVAEAQPLATSSSNNSQTATAINGTQSYPGLVTVKHFFGSQPLSRPCLRRSGYMPYDIGQVYSLLLKIMKLTA